MRRGERLRFRAAAVAALTIHAATVCAQEATTNKDLKGPEAALSIPLSVSGAEPQGSSETLAATSKTPARDGTRAGIKLPELSRISDSREKLGPNFDSPLTGFSRVSGGRRQSGRALWVDNEQKQVKGLGLFVTPRRSGRGAFSVQTAYLHERGSAGGGRASSARNNVWGLTLDGRFWGDTLELGGDYAASWRYLASSDNAGITDTTEGNAYNLRLRFGPGPVALGAHPLRWHLTMNRTAAQSSFWTPGDAPAGQIVERMASNMDWGRLNAGFDYTRSQPRRGSIDNVRGWRRHHYHANLNYSGQPLDWLPLAGPILGTPRYSVSLEHRQSATEDAVTSLDTAALVARFDPGPWQWQLGHTRSVGYRGRGEPVTDRNLTTLQIQWPVGGWLALKPELRWDVHEDRRDHEITRTTAGALAGTAQLVPNSLNASFNINAERYQSDLDNADRNLSTFESSIDWLLWPQRGSTPRLSLSLDGRVQIQRQSGGDQGDEDRYRAFASFTATWPDA